MDARGRMFAATLCIGDHDSSLACPEDARQERESSIASESYLSIR